MNYDDIKKLREQQQQITAEARSYTDQIKDDTSEAEQRELEEKFDRAMADHDAIEQKIERGQKLLAAEERSQRSIDESRRPHSEDDRRADDNEETDYQWDEKAAFTRAIQFGLSKLPEEARSLIKREIAENLPKEMRAQSAGTDTEGGYTVPEGFSNEIVKSMAAWGPMLDPSVTRVQVTATGNRLPWPTIDDTSNVGALLAENTAEGEQDFVVGEKQLDAYKYSSDIIRVSLELLQDSAFNVDALIRELFGERLGRIGNTALTTGTGTSQPNGIATASSLGVTAASASAVTFDEVINLFHSVDPAYRASPNTRFMFNDSTLSAIRKIKDGNSNYIWQPADVRSGEPAQILGVPFSVNQAMASIATGNRSMLFGDFNKYVVRRVRDFTMLRLVERYAENYQVGFLSMMRIDGELLDTAAVKHLVQA